jgi:hypothetical protein
LTKDQTFGGYVDTHRCPPAFRGSDGASYTAEIFVDADPHEGGQFGAAVLFIRWSESNAQPEGHLETGYLAHADTRLRAKTVAESLTLHDLKVHLDSLIEDQKGRPVW